VAVSRYFDALGPQWRLTAAHRDRLTPAVVAAVAEGWAPDRLAGFTGADSTGVRNPYTVLSARLSPDQLPDAPGSASSRPRWCGRCDRQSRFLLDEFGYPSAVPCPECRLVSGEHTASHGAHRPPRIGTHAWLRGAEARAARGVSGLDQSYKGFGKFLPRVPALRSRNDAKSETPM
jgi:hypothetical protein